MAISTHNIFLMTSTDGKTFKKVVDIKDYPNLGGDPEMLQTTTLTDGMHTYIPGIQNLEAIKFTINYDLKTYKEIKKLEAKEEYYAVWFGATGVGSAAKPSGLEGKFKFKGKLTVYPLGKGANEVAEAQIVIAPSTPIEIDETGTLAG